MRPELRERPPFADDPDPSPVEAVTRLLETLPKRRAERMADRERCPIWPCGKWVGSKIQLQVHLRDMHTHLLETPEFRTMFERRHAEQRKRWLEAENRHRLEGRRRLSRSSRER